jgi:subtilisin family serine protease
MFSNNFKAPNMGSLQPKLLISLISACFLFSSIGTVPVQANVTGANHGLDADNVKITQLIVSYELGSSPLDSKGNPNGQESVLGVDLDPGVPLGNGIFTVELPGTFSESDARRISSEIEKSASVKFAQPDLPVELYDTTQNIGIDDLGLWGLDRIDQNTLPLDSNYTYGFSGAGVKAYVIDSGIRSNSDFELRIGSGFSVISDGLGTSDCNGHGTHVAGIIGGRTYGVAKNVELIPVRVFDCTTSTSTANVIAGINWIINDHELGEPAVANMSLGTVYNEVLDLAVMALIADGVSVVVGSGNENKNACLSSPGSTDGTITVNASGIDDVRSSFSNFGVCTDIFAPGQDITSAGISSDSSSAIKSGTSMASPFVSGVVAKILQAEPSLNPQQIANILLTSSSPFISSKTEDPRRLLFSPTDPEIITAAQAQIDGSGPAVASPKSTLRAPFLAAAAAAAAPAPAAPAPAPAAPAPAPVAAAPVAAPATSAPVGISPVVKRSFTLTVDSPAGTMTWIQRKSGTKWVTLKKVTTKARLSVKVSTSGTYRIQIVGKSRKDISKSFKVK